MKFRGSQRRYTKLEIFGNKRITPAEYRQERKRRGLTQAALAALLGVRQSTVSDRERGRRKITREAELALLSLPSASRSGSVASGLAR